MMLISLINARSGAFSSSQSDIDAQKTLGRVFVFFAFLFSCRIFSQQPSPVILYADGQFHMGSISVSNSSPLVHHPNRLFRVSAWQLSHPVDTFVHPIHGLKVWSHHSIFVFSILVVNGFDGIFH